MTMDATIRPVATGENAFDWRLTPHWCSQRGLFGGERRGGHVSSRTSMLRFV